MNWTKPREPVSSKFLAMIHQFSAKKVWRLDRCSFNHMFSHVPSTKPKTTCKVVRFWNTLKPSRKESQAKLPAHLPSECGLSRQKACNHNATFSATLRCSSETIACGRSISYHVWTASRKPPSTHHFSHPDAEAFTRPDFTTGGGTLHSKGGEVQQSAGDLHTRLAKRQAAGGIDWAMLTIWAVFKVPNILPTLKVRLLLEEIFVAAIQGVQRLEAIVVRGTVGGCRNVRCGPCAAPKGKTTDLNFHQSIQMASTNDQTAIKTDVLQAWCVVHLGNQSSINVVPGLTRAARQDHDNVMENATKEIWRIGSSAAKASWTNEVISIRPDIQTYAAPTIRGGVAIVAEFVGAHDGRLLRRSFDESHHYFPSHVVGEQLLPKFGEFAIASAKGKAQVVQAVVLFRVPNSTDLLLGNDRGWGSWRDAWHISGGEVLQGFERLQAGVHRDEGHGSQHQAEMIHNVHQRDPFHGRWEGAKVHLHSQLQIVVVQDALDLKRHQTRILETEELKVFGVWSCIATTTGAFPCSRISVHDHVTSCCFEAPVSGIYPHTHKGDSSILQGGLLVR